MRSDAKARVQAQFGAHAAAYVSAATFRQGATLGALIEAITPQSGQRALDVATGGGHTALELARRGLWVVAGDLTVPMLRAARVHIRAQSFEGAVHYAQLDAEALPFPVGAFDVVTCRVAPHHFPHVARFVRELARVVRSGGTVGVVDIVTPPQPKAARYINAYERLRDPSHIWAYSVAEWQGFFSDAGLRVEHTQLFETRHQLSEWAQRMGRDAPTTLRLAAMLRQAPQPVAEWLRPQFAPSGQDAQFSIWQVLLVGRKE